MKKELVITADGSHSLFLSDWNESYHSKHGAIQESEHVFIKNGLNRLEKEQLNILEFGFGTGLNALTTLKNKKSKQRINYYGLEKYPVIKEVWSAINFADRLNIPFEVFQDLHESAWDKTFQWQPNMSVTKLETDFLTFDYTTLPPIDLVYFDAFGPRVQANLWTTNLFRKIYAIMGSKSYFTTYCCKGDVRRSLISVGFQVAKVSGPPGKREMLVATKSE